MEIDPISESEFLKFRSLIYSMTGIAISEAKRQLVQSRVHRRLRHYRLQTYSEYYKLLTESDQGDAEAIEFINCITTNTTSFFREQHHFDYVIDKIMPDLERQVASGERAPKLRIWHAGCSTGEEPYSLAITFNQWLEKSHLDWDIKQLASDIDTEVLERASNGIYEAEKFKSMPEDICRQYFLRGSGERSQQFKVKQHIREGITFRQINLQADWPLKRDTQFDMIWCRNVIIYFDKETQKKLFARFVDRLKPGGYLFIGHSESLVGITDAFKAVGQTIYRLPAKVEALQKAA